MTLIWRSWKSSVLGLILLIPGGNLASTGMAKEPGRIQGGIWHAWLDSPGGELPFELEIQTGPWKAWILNGEERMEVPRVEFAEGKLVLDIDFYDSKITASVAEHGSRLEGTWVKQSVGDALTQMAFHAVAGSSSRFVPEESAAGTDRSTADIAGRWQVQFESDSDHSVAEFEQDADGTVRGTFLTTVGDYRYLAGQVDGDRLRLSCFDGAHAFLFDARLGEDGALEGSFWSRDTWHETWTAERNDEVVMPDAFLLTKSLDGQSFHHLSFPDLAGRVRSLGEEELVGRAQLIQIFGTWCPNCHDATKFLVELHDRYAHEGLKIVGLAFELTGDAERDAQQVRTYIQRQGIQYPVLLAGTSDKSKASEAVPVLDRIRSYPTTVFLDGEGTVQAVFTGFSGPATGAAHQKLRADFQAQIESLLSE